MTFSGEGLENRELDGASEGCGEDKVKRMYNKDTARSNYDENLILK
jgi:hypothetical protein